MFSEYSTALPSLFPQTVSVSLAISDEYCYEEITVCRVGGMATKITKLVGFVFVE